MSSRIIRGMGVVGVLVGLLAWSGTAQAVKPNPPGKQAGQFVVLGSGDVLDTTTSLRWQQTPGAPGNTVSNCDNGNACNWQEAVGYCAAIGGGSRLAEVKELISLMDFTAAQPPALLLRLPNPFGPVDGFRYWSGESVTIAAPVSPLAWVVGFSGVIGIIDKSAIGLAWCVR